MFDVLTTAIRPLCIMNDVEAGTSTVVLCVLSLSTSSGISTVSLRMNAYTLLAAPNGLFMRPRTFLGVEKDLRHLPRRTPAFPIRNPYNGHDTEYY